MKAIIKKNRFIALDVLRGLFMLIIIVDHLNRFPSLYAWVTGQGRLWISAGEGFFIISGLLVGYTRGYKKLTEPFKKVTLLLFKRALMLYISAVIASGVLLLLTLHSHFPTSLQPSIVVPEHSLKTAIYQILTLHFVFEWVYFLKFYIASLLIAPIFIWLLRKKQDVVAVALACLLWLFGYIIKQDWLQWQVLFFIPAVFGFHLTAIQSWWQELSTAKRRLYERTAIAFFIITIVVSSFWVFGWVFVKGNHPVMSFNRYVDIRQHLDPYFYKVQLSVGRILLALLCFPGLYLLVNKVWPRAQRFLAWLLIPFGQFSLRPYILHGLIILPMQVFLPLSINTWYNTLLTTVAVLASYLLMRIPFIARIVPS